MAGYEVAANKHFYLWPTIFSISFKVQREYGTVGRQAFFIYILPNIFSIFCSCSQRPVHVPEGVAAVYLRGCLEAIQENYSSNLER